MAHAVGLKRSEGVDAFVNVFVCESFFIFFFCFLVMTIGTPFVVIEAALAEFGIAT